MINNNNNAKQNQNLFSFLFIKQNSNNNIMLNYNPSKINSIEINIFFKSFNKEIIKNI